MSEPLEGRQRRLLVGWAVSAVLLIVGVVLLLLTTATTIGLVVFGLGVVGSVVVTVGLLRTRARTDRQAG